MSTLKQPSFQNKIKQMIKRCTDIVVYKISCADVGKAKNKKRFGRFHFSTSVAQHIHPQKTFVCTHAVIYLGCKKKFCTELWAEIGNPHHRTPPPSVIYFFCVILVSEFGKMCVYRVSFVFMLNTGDHAMSGSSRNLFLKVTKHGEA